MSENTVNTELNGGTGANTHPEGNGAQPANEKLFTQEEVNKIVSERLNRERVKAEPSEQEKRESDLTARENRLDCLEYLREKKQSMKFLDILDTSDSSKFKETVEALRNAFPLMDDSIPHPQVNLVGAKPIGGIGDPIANAFKPKY